MLSANCTSSEKIRNNLNGFKVEVGKFGTYLITSSNPITIADKVGLIFTIISLGVILTPIALSDSDPYYLKGVLEVIKERLLFFDNLDNNQDESQYRIITKMKLSPELHLDTTEKIILGKVNPKNL